MGSQVCKTLLERQSHGAIGRFKSDALIKVNGVVSRFGSASQYAKNQPGDDDAAAA